MKPLRRSVLRNIPFEEKAMRRTIRSAFGCILLALACLIAATACSQPEQQVPGNVDMLTVKVIDDTQVKTIGPQGNADITHYVITVVNEAEDIRQQSGYLAKGAQFVVSNVPAGEWFATVDAYVSRDDGSYVKVAGATSAKTLVNAGQKTVLEVVLDSLDQVLSGDVSLTLRMPALLASEGSAFHYQYTISGLGDDLSLFIYNSPILEGATGAEGLASIMIDALDAGLMQGSYMFGITVFDGVDEAGSTIVRRGVDVMRLVNGLPAAGVIDLASYASDQTFQVIVTDSIGDILVPEIVDGKDVYVLNGNSGELTITLSSPLSASQTIEWYVDGDLDETVEASSVADGIYVLFFDHGSHTVTAIVRDANTLMSVGSIDEFKVVLSNIEFIERVDLSSLFSYEPNDDGVNTITITGFKDGAVDENIQPDDNRIFEIPSEIDGKTVTQIGTEAFGQYGRRYSSSFDEDAPEYKILSGKLVLPDSLILIGEGAFDMTLFTDVDFGSGVQKIMYHGLNFYEQYNDRVNDVPFNLHISHLEFPASIKYIGPNIIYGAFETIYFPENLETITPSEGNHQSSYDSRYTCIMMDEGIHDVDIYSGQAKEDFLEATTSFSFLNVVAYGTTASQVVTEASQWFFGVPREDYHAIVNNDSRPYHVPQPVIAVDDGVSISCEKAFAHIYYTLDGTDPDVSDNLYEGDMITDIMDSLVDKEEVTLRAVAYVGNGIYSDVSVKTISLSDVIFNFELNDDRQSYTLTGIKSEALPITDGLEVPAYHNGLPVTAIGTLAFQSDELKTAFPEAYNMAILGMAAETGYQGNDVEEAFDTIVEALSKAKELGAYDGGQVVMDIAYDDAESLAEGLAYVIAFSMIDVTPLEISGVITIPETVGRIGAAAFMNCRITSVEVANVYPSSVSEGIIETCAFFGCSTLESVTIPEGFTTIGHNAFWECLSLKNIIIPDSITTIGERAFAMTSLTSITIPEGVTTIGAGAFYYSLLKSIVLPGNITSIGYGMFKDCSSLTDITIPEEVTSIGIGAFAECSSLKSITIPEHVTSIGSEAFIRCSSLTSIFIPEKVTEIGARVFQTCDELADVYCESLSKPDGWNDKWLGDCSAQVHWGYIGE